MVDAPMAARQVRRRGVRLQRPSQLPLLNRKRHRWTMTSHFNLPRRFFIMSKTEVILTHNIVGLGAESDHVKVAAGYARNYLYPQGLAIPVTGANKRRLESL